MKLEETIINVAQQYLVELESYSKDYDNQHEALNKFQNLSGLTLLAQLEDSGLSVEASKTLADIDQQANNIFSELLPSTDFIQG